MKARWLLLAALCAFFACEEDPVMLNEAPETAISGLEADPGLEAVSIQGSYFVLPPGTWARRAGPVFHLPSPLIESPEAVVQALAQAYRLRDSDLFASILANDPDRNAEFLFLLSEPSEPGETQWGYTEEARIHRRMFHPENPPPGDSPVPAELWPQAIAITLTPLEEFTERVDLYSESGGADGKLDPALWRAMDALYSTYVLFDLAGIDYLVEGRANFVVIEDRTKQVGDSGKFLIFIWEDLGASPPAGVVASNQTTWSNVKGLYR